MNIIELNHIDLNSIGLNSKIIDGIGKSHGEKVKPYIKGHVTDGSNTFTFKVNNADVTVSVSGGDWEYKPTTAITSLAFVGVPQLESLELNKITGVSTFNLDYPVVPVFKKCDATTENALVYVYHIRGTATDNFSFTIKYIDGSNNITTVTENAVIDGNGKWKIEYSGKHIQDLYYAFRQNTVLTSIEFSEDMSKCAYGFTSYKGVFGGASNLEYISFQNATFDIIDRIDQFCISCASLVEIYAPKAIFKNVTQIGYTFSNCNTLKTIAFDSAELTNLTSTMYAFNNCNELIDLSIKAIGMNVSLSNSSKLSEQSVINLFNAVAADGITLTFHPTVFAMIEQQLEIEDSPIYNAYWNSEYDFEYTTA